MLTGKNIAVIIPTLNRSTLNRTFKSLISQTVFVGEIIIVNASKKKINLESKNLKVINSQIKNQVFQRKLGFENLNEYSKVVLFLDDRVVLEKNTIKELLYEWRSCKAQVVGIGLSCVNYNPPKINIFHRLTITNSDKQAKVLSSGFISGYGAVGSRKKSQWLNGGMSSWRVNKIKKIIKSRNYPLIKWSVGEDVIFSYRFGKKKQLYISSRARCVLLNKSENMNYIQSYLKGFYHSYITKSFVMSNSSLLKSHYFYSIYTSSILGIISSLLTCNMKNFLRFLGRLIGSFFYYRNIS